MKKNMFVAVFLVTLMASSVALAAVSSPCGARKPKSAPAPRVAKDEGYRRDVLGTKVPVESITNRGDAMTDVATKYNETLVSGKD